MSMNEKHFNKASALLEQRRSINRATEELRHSEVCKKLPKYAQLEEQLAETSKDLIMLLLNKEGNTEERLSLIEQNNLSLQSQMKDLLTEGGFPEDYLEHIYTCPKCCDKGTVDGKWCECFNRLMLKSAAEDLNEVSPLKLSSFDKFRLDLYSDAKDEKLGTSPRAIMKQNLDYCMRYASDFSADSDSILMNGGTGLGKTHLSLAIAEAAIEKGHSVIYGSCPEFLRTLEREHFGRSAEDTMPSLTRCDLLILDDLGAETDKPLYTSLLYELINSRISRCLPTIISSNLDVNELKQRYHDRIWSRLFSMEVLMFVGNDVRRMLKKK